MLKGPGASCWLLATGPSRSAEIPGFAPRRHRRFALYSELPHHSGGKNGARSV